MKKTACLALLMAAALALGGCAVSAEPAPAPAPEGATARAQVDWPKERLETDENGVPVLDVYVVADEQVERVDVETYVEGVLAGEMKNDWPLEALKAQAILARTFVLKFLADKQSKYEGADISTDIEEAQAYDASAVNDRIRQAVSETEGLVLSAGGELPYAWFHAHSGGLTALAREGLGWDKDEPPYTQIVPGNEPESAAGEKDAQMLREAQHWQASFPYEEVEAACETLGVDVTLHGRSEADHRGARRQRPRGAPWPERAERGRVGPSHRARVHEDALNPHHQPARAGGQARHGGHRLRPRRGHEPVGRLWHGAGGQHGGGDRDVLL